VRMMISISPTPKKKFNLQGNRSNGYLKIILGMLLHVRRDAKGLPAAIPPGEEIHAAFYFFKFFLAFIQATASSYSPLDKI
jgi:hypothetical protein